MHFRTIIHLIAFLLSACFLNTRAGAQSPNPCGVVAGISPSTADSVVPMYTLVPFTNVSTNATSVSWLLDGSFSGSTNNVFNYAITTGMHTISLVAYKDNCTDTMTVVYFAAGEYHN